MDQSNTKLDILTKDIEEVMQKQNQLEKTEKVILAKVSETEREEQKVEHEIEEAEEITIVQETLLNKIRKHKYLFPLVTVLGVILVWRGLWNLFDQIPFINYSLVSLMLGLIILWAFNRIRSLK